MTGVCSEGLDAFIFFLNIRYILISIHFQSWKHYEYNFGKYTPWCHHPHDMEPHRDGGHTLLIGSTPLPDTLYDLLLHLYFILSRPKVWCHSERHSKILSAASTAAWFEIERHNPESPVLSIFLGLVMAP